MENEAAFQRLRAYIVHLCGIDIPSGKSYLFETRFARMMAENGIHDFEEFYQLILASGGALDQPLINAIATHETQWFRDSAPWNVIEETLLPRWICEIAEGRRNRIRIWFSAVSTGQEAYSTVMCIDRYLRKNHIKEVSLSNFYFFATDISVNAVGIAKKGRYNRISITRGLGGAYRNEYFANDGSVWEIDERIRRAVSFRQLNLLGDYSALGHFDLIFCRYLLIYFPQDIQKKVAYKMHNALTVGGVLFTGNYVMLDLFSPYFDPCHYGNMTYYAKK
ncbi:MAG: protein-glutamate O-methyltransferase CheR [Clostridiales bacterium]|jgi:chemotaxis protein methyltransferase CheR|nr:protein-glutamate O-methyltransferase CheR [Clostridiales bacterium]